MTARTDRLDELLRQEIGAILARDVNDPRIGFVTVTRVETAPDLSTARVWVSVIGEQADRQRTLRALEGVMHFARRELGSRLRLRRIPDLHVRLDESAERGTRVLRLIEDLEAGRDPLDDLPPEGETLPTPVVRARQEGDAEETPEAPVAGEPPRQRRPRGRRPGNTGRPGDRPGGKPATRTRGSKPGGRRP